MGLSADTKLEHYQIVGPLGAGGMGEVYRAMDTKLKREVALKILPDRFASDPARLLRFEREATVLATLNHPNIGAIYGLENSGGIRFLVLELVEGPTLADRIQAGPIAVSEAMDIATQIAEALEAAHDKGVVHRDLKPANIKLTPGGKVKVLDFGLAKAFGDPESVADPSNSPTITMEETAGGVVMGTASYMSPEQAEGKPVDKRADVWAFGVVLFEMLTGRRLFDGKSTSHIIVHVIEQDPDWSKLPPLPSGIQDLLERCLQKDPTQRLRDIGDVRIQLQAAITKPVQLSAQRSKTQVGPRRWLLPVVAVLAALVVAGFYFLNREPPPAPDVMRFEIAQPGSTSVTAILRISPDGRRLAFIASNAGQSRLWVRSLETLEAHPLDGTEGVLGIPFWSPDSRFLAFYSQGKLKKIEATGGPAQTLADSPSLVAAGFWAGNDKIVFAPTNGVLLQTASLGGTPTPLSFGGLAENEGALFPSPMPDGKFVYCRCGEVQSRGIYVASLDGGSPRQILPDSSNVVYAPSSSADLGYLLFVRGAPTIQASGTLMAQPIHPHGLTFAGDPIPIAENVSGLGFSASSTGVLVYSANSSSVPVDVPGMVRGQLTWLDRQGHIVSTVGDPGIYRIPALSPPDAKYVALEESDPANQNIDIYLFEFARGISNRFTFHADREVSPVWSADGKYLVFTRFANPGSEWYRKSSNLAADEELLFKTDKLGVPSTWSPDGRFLLYTTLPAPAEIMAVDLSAKLEDRKPIPVVISEYNDINARISPDGKWFSYSSNESGTYEIYVRPFNLGAAEGSRPSNGGKVMVSKGGGGQGGAMWRQDGKELFYIAPDGTLMSVDVTSVPTFSPMGPPKSLFKVPDGILFFDVSRDGQRFLLPMTAAAGVSSPPYTVVLNWTSTLKTPRK